jgi:hypothetical protein
VGGKETMSRWETVPPADLGQLPRDRDKVRTWLAILRVLDAASGGRGASPSPDGGTPQAMAARRGDREAHAYELPRVFRTGNLRLIHAAACMSRYSSMTSCGVR